MDYLDLVNHLLYEDADAEVDDSTVIEKDFWNAGRANEKNIGENDVDPSELKAGIKIEMEHTTNKDIAKRIALDHLAEIKNYYTLLKKMESDAMNGEED